MPEDYEIPIKVTGDAKGAREVVEGLESVGKAASEASDSLREAQIAEEGAAAAELFPDGTFDFIYIDASHAYHDVVCDLRAWLPKTKVGGILCGHDYLYISIADSYPVHAAVDRFWQGNPAVEPLAFSNDWVLRRIF